MGGLGEELQVLGQEGGSHLRAKVHQQVRAARPVADPGTLSIDIYINYLFLLRYVFVMHNPQWNGKVHIEATLPIVE